MAELQEAEARARLLKRHASAGDFWIPIEGTSMGSGFRRGDRVRVQTLDRDPRFGEVWVFCARGGETVAHRFLRRSKHGFVFRGDARTTSDLPIVPTQLVGRATLILRGDHEVKINRWPGILVGFRAIWTKSLRFLRKQGAA